MKGVHLLERVFGTLKNPRKKPGKNLFGICRKRARRRSKKKALTKKTALTQKSFANKGEGRHARERKKKPLKKKTAPWSNLSRNLPENERNPSC